MYSGEQLDMLIQSFRISEELLDTLPIHTGKDTKFTPAIHIYTGHYQKMEEFRKAKS